MNFHRRHGCVLTSWRHSWILTSDDVEYHDDLFKHITRVYARLPILTFFSKLLQVPDFWLKGHVNSGLRPFLGLFIKNWVSAPGYSAGTWFWSSACAGKFRKIDISRTTGPIKLADPTLGAGLHPVCGFAYRGFYCSNRSAMDPETWRNKQELMWTPEIWIWLHWIIHKLRSILMDFGW